MQKHEEGVAGISERAATFTHYGFKAKTSPPRTGCVILLAESVVVDTEVRGVRLGGPTVIPEMVTVKVPGGMPSVGVAVRMILEVSAATETVNRSVGVKVGVPEARNNEEATTTVWPTLRRVCVVNVRMTALP